MWIKICGMTTPDAIAAALEAGADAIGFVFEAIDFDALFLQRFADAKFLDCHLEAH